MPDVAAQEPASVALSLANLWAHCVGFRRLRACWTRSYPLRALWAVYAVLSANTWVWSAVFHARDTRRTEALDYFSADTLLAYTLFAVTVRARRLFRPRDWLLLAALLAAGLVLHVRHMLFTLFDYGLNMKARMMHMPAARSMC